MRAASNAEKKRARAFTSWSEGFQGVFRVSDGLFFGAHAREDHAIDAPCGRGLGDLGGYYPNSGVFGALEAYRDGALRDDRHHFRKGKPGGLGPSAFKHVDHAGLHEAVCGLL